MQEWEEKILDRQEAHQEGYKEGRTAGAKEQQYSIAAKLKEKGLPLNEIAEITGLSVDEAERL